MSEPEQTQPESGGTDWSPSESAHSPSEGQSVDSKASCLLLTVENVKKLQEEYPTSKSALARRSIEAYIKQSSNHLLNESGSSTDRSKDQKPSDEQEAEATAFVPHKDNTSEGYPGKSDVSSKDFQTRSLPSSVPEAETFKEHEFADLETQTEWSYSTASLESSEEEKRKSDQEEVDEEEKREDVVEKEEIPSGSAEEEGGRDEIEPESTEGFSPSPPPPPQKEVDADVPTLSDVQDHSITDLCHLGCCEFCTSLLKPLPSPEELEEQPEIVESKQGRWLTRRQREYKKQSTIIQSEVDDNTDLVLCHPSPYLRTYKEIFHCVIQELMEQEDTLESEIDINPHPHLSSTVLESDTKKQLKKEIEDRGFENYREILRQYITFGPCMKVAFRLKDYPPKPPKTAAKKKQRPRPEEILEIDSEFKADQLKICHPTKPVKRYYPNGNIFYLLFPDGTGQVYYPSGNIAILITYVKGVQFTYIILSDSAQHEVQAFFTNQGRAACYHPNGHIRMNLDLCSGSYFDQKEIQQKRWNWWDTSRHIHAPPFQPISIQLNVYIQLKVESQDQIFLIFTKHHDCLQLNVGARLKIKDQNMLQYLKSPENLGQLLSHSKILQIRRLLAKFHKLLKVLSCSPSEHTQDLCLIVSDLCDVLQRQCRTKKISQAPAVSAYF